MSHAKSRRAFMRQGGRLALVGGLAKLAAGALPAQAAYAPHPPPPPLAQGERSLALAHTHTRERLSLVYAVGSDYLPEALQRLNHMLRDHYSGEVGRMDPSLLDQLHRLRQLFGTAGAFEVISAYRCEATNAQLKSSRGGGVAKRSLHLQGRAIDIRLPGVPLSVLHKAALAMQAGGVGYYPREQFVHLDTGPVRRW